MWSTDVSHIVRCGIDSKAADHVSVHFVFGLYDIISLIHRVHESILWCARCMSVIDTIDISIIYAAAPAKAAFLNNTFLFGN